VHKINCIILIPALSIKNLLNFIMEVNQMKNHLMKNDMNACDHIKLK